MDIEISFEEIIDEYKKNVAELMNANIVKDVQMRKLNKMHEELQKSYDDLLQHYEEAKVENEQLKVQLESK